MRSVMNGADIDMCRKEFTVQLIEKSRGDRLPRPQNGIQPLVQEWFVRIAALQKVNQTS